MIGDCITTSAGTGRCLELALAFGHLRVRQGIISILLSLKFFAPLTYFNRNYSPVIGLDGIGDFR